MDSYLFFTIFTLLMGVALFIKFELTKIRALCENLEKARKEVSRLNVYQNNTLALLKMHVDKGIGVVVNQTIKGRIVLFGFNHIAAFLMKELEGCGNHVTCIIENNESVRLANRHKKIPLISTMEALNALADGDEIIICILHDKAYLIAEELKNSFGKHVNIHLLEHLLRSQQDIPANHGEK